MATTIVIALPAAPTWKKTFGFHPMTAFADHGAGRNGEPLTMVLRNGSAGSNTAADHIEASRLALAQLPRRLRRKVLIRADSGGGTHGFLEWLTANSRRLYYSVGMTITEDMQDAVLQVPAGSWRPAYDGDGQVRDGPGSRTSPGCYLRHRVIVRKERPHPGAQLRFTDIDAHRFTALTAFTTDAKKGQLAGLELRHRRRGLLRGPDPRREGHRTPQPAPEELRPEPAVVRDRRPGLRAPGLDPDARPHREPPAAGNPDGSGSACSPSPDASPAAPAACGSDSPSAGPGPTRSPPRSPARKPCRPTNQQQPSLRHRRSNPGPVEPAHPARQPGSQPRPGPEKTTSRTVKASTSGTRKIEVSAFSPGPAATC